ncbi:9052_t:CDS:2, partial [Cetraspora pellucida]
NNPDKKKDLTAWKIFSGIIDDYKMRTGKSGSLEINLNHAMSLSRGWRNTKDYFARHYQNSTEELVVQIKQLKSEKERLENEVITLKEELTTERETNQESAEAMDHFYRNQFIENRTPDVLAKFNKNYLAINRENKQKDQVIKQLEETIERVKKIVEQEYQGKETKEQGVQTELSFQKINELEKKQKNILKTISHLNGQLVDLQIHEQKTQTEIPPK